MVSPQENHSVSSAPNTLVRSLVALVACATLVSCDDKVVAPVMPLIHSLDVYPSPATVRVGQDLVMVAKVKADSGANVALTWRSSDPRRVAVSASGILTGVSVGPAVVTVSPVADPSLVRVITVDVTPRYSPVTNITASPASVSLIPGQTQAIVANVVADAGVSRSVTYTSANPSVATVSAQGTVVGLTVGTTVVTARSTADTSMVTIVPVTVRAPTGARISIQAITARGTATPVDLLNVQGQVDVLINVEPGERALARVSLVVSNSGRDTTVASQSFSAQQSNEFFATGVQGAISAGVIVQSFRSDVFNTTTGVVTFRNGATTLKAVAEDLTPTGTAQVSASSSVTALLNNADGFLAAVRPLSTTGVPNAIDPAGRRWVQAGRGLVVTTTPVMFSGRALGARTISYPGVAPVATVTSSAGGVSVDTLALPAGYVSSNSGDAYVNGDLPGMTATDVAGNSLPLIAGLASGAGAGIMNVQPTFTAAGRLEGLRIDNAPPPAPTLVISAAQNNANNWVNGDYLFASGLSPLTQDNGVGLPGAAANPTVTSANVVLQAFGDGLVDTIEVTRGSGLPPSNTNTAYGLIARLADRLGNVRVVPLTGAGAHPGIRFGVDLQPPTLRYATGSLDGKTLVSTNADSVFTTATGGTGPRAFAVEAIDDRSGLPSGRVAVSITRFAQPNPDGTYSGTVTCVTGIGATCAPVQLSYETVLPDDYRRVSAVLDGGTGLEGYYTFTARAQDQAGNLSEPRTKRALIDLGTGASAPSMTGLGITGVLVGGQTASFIALATDNIELARGGMMLEYPNLPGTTQILAYGTLFGGATTLGVAFDSLLTSPIAGTHPAFRVPKFIRGLEVVDTLDAPTVYPAATAKPTAANAWVTDFAFGGAPSTLPANVPIVSGTVQSPGANAGFRSGIGTSNELQKWRRSGTNGLRFEAVGPSGQAVSPFARVMIVRLEPTGLVINSDAWRVIGEITTPVGTDNGLRRVWVYDFGGLGSGSFLAIGVNANGDAIATRIVTQ
jgi:hypothetical protein